MNLRHVLKTCLRIFVILLSACEGHLHHIPRWLGDGPRLMHGPSYPRWVPTGLVPPHSRHIQAPRSRGTILQHTIMLNGNGNGNTGNPTSHYIQINLSTGRNPNFPTNTNRPIGNRSSANTGVQNRGPGNGNGNLQSVNNNNNKNNKSNNNNNLNARNSVSGRNTRLPFGMMGSRNNRFNLDNGLLPNPVNNNNNNNNNRVQRVTSRDRNIPYSINGITNPNVNYNTIIDLLSNLQQGISRVRSSIVATGDTIPNTADMPSFMSGEFMTGGPRTTTTAGSDIVRSRLVASGMTAEEIAEAFEA